MNLEDFKAWLAGFAEGLKGGAPTREQWEAVLTQAEKIVPGDFRLGPDPAGFGIDIARLT